MSMNVFRPVALIPVYNHHQVIDELLDALDALDLPVILVDDGSNDLCARSLDVSAASHRKASLVRLAKNGGKGAAVALLLTLVRWTSQPHRIGRQVSCALQKTAAKGRR